MRPSALRFGLSLIEVLVALVILAVGIFGVAQLQASSLRSSALAEALNETTRFVRAEVEWQRQIAAEPVVGQCSHLVDDLGVPLLPPGFGSCTVTIEPCAYGFVDGGGCPATSPNTYRLTVAAVGPRDQAFELSALWTGTYVSGAAGSLDEGLVTGGVEDGTTSE